MSTPTPATPGTLSAPWPGDSFRDRRNEEYRVVCTGRMPSGKGVQVVYRRVRDGLILVLPLVTFRDAYRRVRAGQRKRKVG